jgi:hypothetical protein
MILINGNALVQAIHDQIKVVLFKKLPSFDKFNITFGK